jgi:hypothetical protein
MAHGGTWGWRAHHCSCWVVVSGDWRGGTEGGADLGGMVYLKWKPEWSGGFGLGFNLLVGAHLLLWL